MHELAEAVTKICRHDPRYAIDAYFFVFEALHYAHKTLELAQAKSGSVDFDDEPSDASPDYDDAQIEYRHLTCQQLCEAIRLYSLDQYGYLAKCVLNHWDIEKTGDFGDIVFNLIDAGEMKKTPDDKRENFDDVFDFDAGLCRSFKFSVVELRWVEKAP